MKKPITTDIHSLAEALIRGCHAEMDMGLEYSTGGKKRLRQPKVKENAITRCANVHLKVKSCFKCFNFFSIVYQSLSRQR